MLNNIEAVTRGLKMSTGKYISLEKARKTGQLERFAKEHPSKVKKKDFDALLDNMCKAKKPKAGD